MEVVHAVDLKKEQAAKKRESRQRRREQKERRLNKQRFPAPPKEEQLTLPVGCGYLRCACTRAARRRSRIGTMVWRAGWCGINPELSENVRAGLKAKAWDKSAPVRLNA